MCAAYGVVGIGAAAYSPAKYGIVTEMLPPSMLVKGNSWIEGLTVLSIILGTVLGGLLISSHVSNALLHHSFIGKLVHSPAEAAILVIAFVYLLAALCNLMIPQTHVRYPPQQKNPIRLMGTFWGYVCVLWRDKLGQISLAVTTLFWGAGATLQLIVIEWGRSHLGYQLDKASILMGVAALGTVVGSILAGRIPLRRALSVLPVGAAMGLVVLLMPLVYAPWSVYLLLLVTGGLAGFFVVPMNALLQHRGHVLLSAGHSIAVQNFNEQLNILLMVAMYTAAVAAAADQRHHRDVRHRGRRADGGLHALVQAQPAGQSGAAGADRPGRSRPGTGSRVPERCALRPSAAADRQSRLRAALIGAAVSDGRACLSGGPVTHTGQLWRFSAAAPIGRA